MNAAAFSGLTPVQPRLLGLLETMLTVGRMEAAAPYVESRNLDRHLRSLAADKARLGQAMNDAMTAGTLADDLAAISALNRTTLAPRA